MTTARSARTSAVLGPALRLALGGRGRALLGRLDPGDDGGDEAEQPAPPPGPGAARPRPGPPQRSGPGPSGAGARCTGCRPVPDPRRSRRRGCGHRAYGGQQDALAAHRGGQPGQQVRPHLRPRVRDVDDAAPGRSVSGCDAASRARSMPYLAISSAALAVSASASGGVTPSASAFASSLRTRSSRALGGSECMCNLQVDSVELSLEPYPPGMTFGGPAREWRGLPRPRTLHSATMAVQISPSILSADFARLADEAAAVARRCGLAARGRHGQPLRAEPHPRPAGGRSRCSSTQRCRSTAT